MPRDPQGAETRTETQVVWRNVYEENAPRVGEWRSAMVRTREAADALADDVADTWPRIAIERIETTTTITRHPIPPHAGEETKG